MKGLSPCSVKLREGSLTALPRMLLLCRSGPYTAAAAVHHSASAAVDADALTQLLICDGCRHLGFVIIFRTLSSKSDILCSHSLMEKLKSFSFSKVLQKGKRSVHVCNSISIGFCPFRCPSLITFKMMDLEPF